MKKIYLKKLLLLFFLLFLTKILEAKNPKPTAISLTSPTLTNLCVGNSNYTPLGDIVISETAGNEGDISDGASTTIILTAPTGIEFEPSTGSGSVTGAGATFGSLSVTSSTITFTATFATSTTELNTITISGLNVRATANVSSVTLKRTGGTMNIVGFGVNVDAATFSTQTGIAITSPTLSNLCIGSSSYISLNDIVITEVCANHILQGTNRTLILNAPSGIEFQPSTGSVNITGGGTSSSSISVTSSTITVSSTFSGGSLNNINTIRISGINVRATSSVSSVNLTRGGGTMSILDLPVGSVLATFSTLPVVTPPTITAGTTQYFNIGTNVNTTNIAATSTTNTITWYSDAALTNILTVVTPTSPRLQELGVSTATSGNFTVYATETSGTGCESLAITLNIIVCADVTITAPTLTNLCVGNSNYTNLGNIVINEGCLDKFPVGNGQTLVLSMPAGVELQSSTGTLSFGSTGNFFTNSLLFVSNNAIFISFDAAAGSNTEVNTITISGLRARATSTVSNVNLTRTGGTATIPNLVNGTVLARFSSSVPAPPTFTMGITSFQTTQTTGIDLTSGANSVSPSGGTFSGPGITGNNFFPNAAPVGANTLTYTVTDVNGCTSSASVNVTVNNAGFIIDSKFCRDAPDSAPLIRNDVSPACITQLVESNPSFLTSNGANGGTDPIVFVGGNYIFRPSNVAIPTGQDFVQWNGSITFTSTSNSFPNPPCPSSGYLISTYIFRVPNPSITGSLNVCSGQNNVTYSVPSIPNNTYIWSVTGGTIVGSNTGNSVLVNWNTIPGPSSITGTISVTQTANYTSPVTANCSKSDTKNITINPLPTPNIVGSTTTCANQTGTTYSTAAGNNYLWTVTGGTIVGSNTTNSITIDWGTAGTGTVQVTETNPTTNCVSIVSRNITINALPTPTITGNFSICANKTGEVYQVTSVAGHNYNWNVVGGTITAGQSSNAVTVSWGSNPIGARIEVTQTNTLVTPNCSRLVTQNIIILPLPTPNITGALQVCEFSTGNTYSTPNTAGHNYNWSISGGTINSGQGNSTIQVTWNATGTGTLTVVQTDLNSCSNVASTTLQNITINPLPNPTITGNSAVCASSVGQTYSVTSTVGRTYLWNVTGGVIASGQNTNSITVDWGTGATGNVQVIETITATNCNRNTSMGITIRPLPTPTITTTNTFPAPFSVCASSTQTYSVTSVSGHTYNWVVTGGTITGGQTTNQITVAWGTNPVGAKVEVTQTNTNLLPNCSRLASQNIVILPLPTPNITGDAQVCELSTGNVYSTPFIPLNTYVWTITGGTITNGAGTSQITVTWGGTGTGSLSVVQTDVNNCSNTAVSTLRNIIINPLPNPIITGNNVVCASSIGQTYSVTSASGRSYLWNVTGGVITSGQNTSSITVDWGTGATGIVQVTETINANPPALTTNCSKINVMNITINPLPTPTITGGVPLTNNVCATGTYTYQVPNVVGHGYNWTVTNGTINSGQGTNQISVTWNSLTVGKVEVIQTNLATSCLRHTEVNTVILPLPTPAITGPAPAIVTQGEVCEDNEYNYSTPPVTGHFYNWEVGTGTIISGTGTANIRVKWDNPSNTEFVRVTQTSNTNPQCSQVTQVAVIVRPKPYTNITIANNCLGDITTFTPSVIDPSWTWEWQFPDNTTSNIPNPTKVFSDAGSFLVRLTTRNPFGCIHEQLSIPLAINPVPVANFRFLGTCLGSTTQFTNLSTIATTNASIIQTWTWNFGDGSPVLSGNFPNPTKVYTIAGVYNVTLTVTSNKGCSHTITKPVAIFPFVAPTDLDPYTETFENNNHGWIAGTTTNVPHTWQLGVPATNRTTKNSTGRVWSTGLNANYTNNQKSYVESPCFSLVGIDKPMLVVKYWSDTDNNADGAVILYTFDEGQTWKPLGNVGDGLDWYNANNILGAPGEDAINPSRRGWTGQKGKWIEGRYALDFVRGEVGNNPVRFRISFGSNSDNPATATLDGFSFDDVYVGNRKAKLLLEYFTSTNPTAATENAYVNVFPTPEQSELVVMQYFTDFLGDDPLYRQNPHDATARASYHEISKAPRVALDGESDIDDLFSIWGPQRYSQLALLPAPFKVRFAFPPSPFQGNLRVTMEIEALDNYVRPIVAFLGLVEKQVTSTQLGIAGTPVIYKNVVRKMLPNAGGVYFNRVWATGNKELLTFDIPLYQTPQNNPNIPFFYDWNNLIVTGFVQDDITFDILDADRAVPATLPPLVSSLAEDGQGEFTIYPNPATDVVSIGFEETSKNDYEWQIYDLQGKKILNGILPTGEKTIKIDVSKFAKGMYIVNVVHTKNKHSSQYKLQVK